MYNCIYVGVCVVQRLVQLPLRIERSLVKTIDEIVSRNPNFVSRSDYIRKNLYLDIERDKEKMLDETALEIRALLVKRGAKPGLMTKKQKANIAEDFLREKRL